MKNPKVVIGFTTETMETSKSHIIAIVSIYSIIMKNTSIIHIINYSSLQVIRPRCYCRHRSSTSDCAFYIKNPCTRRLFIPLLVQRNRGNLPFLAENGKNIQKLTSEFFFKIVHFFSMEFNKECMLFHRSHT